MLVDATGSVWLRLPVSPSVSSLLPSELLDVDFGEPLHSLVICGTTHPLEDELLKWHRVAVADRPAAEVPAEGIGDVDATPEAVEAAAGPGAGGVEDGEQETSR